MGTTSFPIIDLRIDGVLVPRSFLHGTGIAGLEEIFAVVIPYPAIGDPDCAATGQPVLNGVLLGFADSTHIAHLDPDVGSFGGGVDLPGHQLH